MRAARCHVDTWEKKRSVTSTGAWLELQAAWRNLVPGSGKGTEARTAPRLAALNRAMTKGGWLETYSRIWAWARPPRLTPTSRRVAPLRARLSAAPTPSVCLVRASLRSLGLLEYLFLLFVSLPCLSEHRGSGSPPGKELSALLFLLTSSFAPSSFSPRRTHWCHWVCSSKSSSMRFRKPTSLTSGGARAEAPATSAGWIV